MADVCQAFERRCTICLLYTSGRIGELAANMLLALMRGETPERHCIDVGFELVMRDSA